jgi:LAO/AO transport system kinase
LNSIHNTSVDKFVSEILNNNISYLSRAITLAESNNSKHQAKANQILEQCLPHSNKSVRIGITGVPGVGKSTFIEVFGKYLTCLGKKVAVLAIDPSSSIQKGSILGDKTRMETLVNDENAFIRPSPSGESLGGVARKTRETITLCEAAGFDVIIIETVGVGQSETTVHSMVDFFLLLKLANAGDELQGIKRGIIEMADAIAINKADGLNVSETNLAKTEFVNALHLFPAKESHWIPKVVTCSALDNKGIDEIYKMISEYFTMTKKNGYFYQKRNSQNKNWLLETIDNELKNEFYQNEKVQEAMKKFIKKIENNEINPFQAAKEILKIKR